MSAIYDANRVHGNIVLHEENAMTLARVAAGLVAVLAVIDVAAAIPDAVAQLTLPLTQARPDTGSRIRKGLVKLTVPATDPYDRLTPEQKNAFLALFDNLPADYEPAYPLEGLRPVANSMAFALSDGAVGEGDLFLTVQVDDKGEPQSTKIYASPSSRVSREAAAALMSIKYKPARCAGKPCSAEFPFTAKFEFE
jgi:hypothetical protein